MEFSFAGDDRDSWGDEAAAAVVVAAGRVRRRMLTALSNRNTLPSRARSVFRDGWWERELDRTVAPVYADVAGQAVTSLNLVVPEDRVRGAIVSAGAVAVGLLMSRADVVHNRVTDLLATAKDEGRTPGWVATQLGLIGEGASGPLSDAVADSLGRTSATNLVEGVGYDLLSETGVGSKTWRCSMVPASRDTHIEADGQTVGLDEDFEIGGYPASFPADDRLPVEEVAGCLCYLEYDLEDTGFALAASAQATFVLDPAATFVTVEPTATEKTALALGDGDPADLRIPLLDLGAVDESGRVTVSTALAGLAAVTPPLSGTVSGTGWLADPGVTVGIVDCPGLTALRTDLVAALVDLIPDPGEFLPVLILAAGSVDATALSGTPLHFNEIRFRVGGETLVFDLLGPTVQAPIPEPAQPETPPAPSDIAPIPEAPTMPPTATITNTTGGNPATTFAAPAPPTAPPPPPMPEDAPTDTPPVDLASASDDDLAGEIGRRAAQKASDDGAGTVDDLVGEATDEARVLIDQIAIDLEEDVTEPADGAPPMPAPVPAMAVAPPVAAPVYEWEAISVIEGVMSDDGRKIEVGALDWRDLPLTQMLQTVNALGHEGSVACSSIHEFERVDDSVIMSRGMWSSMEAGALGRALVEERTVRGVSVDLCDVSAVYLDDAGVEVDPMDAMFGAPATLIVVAGTIMGQTITPFPAFRDATIRILDPTAVVAAGGPAEGIWRIEAPITFHRPGETPTAALVASATQTTDHAPPRSVFALRPMSEPEPFHVAAPLPDGTIPCYGLIAAWDSCHIGMRGCTPPPRGDDFTALYTGKATLTREGDRIPTAPIFMDTVHPNLRRGASDTQAHYADTGTAAADVHLYENEHGIVAAGCLRPDTDPLSARRLRASDISPDWRTIGHRLRMVALLAVNASGFNVPFVEGLAASAGHLRPIILRGDNQETLAMVASGAIRHDPPALSAPDMDVLAELAELRSHVTALQAIVEDTILAPRRATRAQTALTLLRTCKDCDPV